MGRGARQAPNGYPIPPAGLVGENRTVRSPGRHPGWSDGRTQWKGQVARGKDGAVCGVSIGEQGLGPGLVDQQRFEQPPAHGAGDSGRALGAGGDADHLGDAAQLIQFDAHGAMPPR